MEIFWPVGAAFGYRSDMINVVKSFDGLPAVSTQPALRREQSHDVCGRVRPRHPSSSKAIDFRRNQPLFMMFEARSFFYFPRVVMSCDSATPGIRRKLASVFGSRLSLRFGNALWIGQSVIRRVADYLFLVSLIINLALRKSFHTVFGVPIRMISVASSLLFGKEPIRRGLLLRFAARKLCGDLIKVYDSFSHVEVSSRLVRGAVSVSSADGASLYTPMKSLTQPLSQFAASFLLSPKVTVPNWR